MKIIKQQKALRDELDQLRQAGTQSVGFVPTMGGLHAGHMSLVNRSLRENQITVVSVFLNPTQFNDPKDLETYPHNTEEDISLLEDAGVDILFLPTADEMYPKGEVPPAYALGRVAEVMEGEHRPGHFQGVVWIVSKLFRLVHPTRAYFGLKDFQQIAVIKKMVELSPDMDVEIVPCEVVREKDGLAMSSRNKRLSSTERKVAPHIYRCLKDGVALMRSGHSVEEVKSEVIRKIESQPLLRVEYFSIVNGDTLEEVSEWGDDTVGCITVFCGEVRLIDHIAFTH